MPSGNGTLSSDKAIQVKLSACLWMEYVNSKAIYIVLMKHSSLLFLPNKTTNTTNQKMEWAVKYYLKKSN